MKRFYKLVSLRADATGGHLIELDGRVVKTPAGTPLGAPTLALAEGLQREWAAQGDSIVPDTMPMTQILTTCTDRLPRDRQILIDGMLRYIDTDLVFYRAPASSPYAARQAAHWDPVVSWARDFFNTDIRITHDLETIVQTPALHTGIGTLVTALDDHRLMALSLVTGEAGSILLGIGLMAGAFSADQVYQAILAEDMLRAEIYDEEKYGAAPQDEKSRAILLRFLHGARAYFIALA